VACEKGETYLPSVNEDKTRYMQIKRTGIKYVTHLKTDNFAFENFNYLRSILNADNKMNIEIYERITKGNKAYYSNAKLIKSKFLKKSAEMKIYKTMIRPVVRFSSQTWTVTAKDENNLRIFERQILSKIFGTVNIDSIWRIRNNMVKEIPLQALTDREGSSSLKLPDFKQIGT
jgi:hypothetical protein